MEEVLDRLLEGKDSWFMVKGRPHRHELGEFILRWTMAGCPSNTTLVTGPCNRPFNGFLDSYGIEWIQLEQFNVFGLQPQVFYSELLALDLPPLGGRNVERFDLPMMGTALLEGDMEDFLYRHPKHLASTIGEDSAIDLIGRQFSIPQGRPDIIYADANKRICIVECKRGELHRSHIGQLIEYCRPKDTRLAGARLILLLNSANGEVVHILKKVGLEVCVYPYESLVNAMLRERYTPPRRKGFTPTIGRVPLSILPDEAPVWKVEFVAAFRRLLPSHLAEELSVSINYKSSKKLRIARTVDDFTVLYVDSNAGRLEFGLPIMHRLLLAGVPLEVMKTKGPAVFLSKGGQVPNITIEVKANDAIEWIARYRDEFIDALEHYADGLNKVVINAVLQHLGATIQDSNASKLQATGLCSTKTGCDYCAINTPFAS